MTAIPKVQGPTQSLTAFLPISAKLDASHDFAGDPGLWLPEPAMLVEPGRWVIRLHAGVTSHTVVCEVGVAAEHADAVWRGFTWQASDLTGRSRVVDRAFPQFRGEIGLVTAPAPTLVLTGTYDPPGGSFGYALDRVGLERIANMSGRRLLSDIAARLRASADAGL